MKTEEALENERNKYEKGYTTYNMSLEIIQIILPNSNEIIGACDFHNWYPIHRRAELGYSISNEKYWNKGLLTEALEAVIEHFENTII